MPYIKKSRREVLDQFIEDVPVSVVNPGELNYVIMKIILKAIGPSSYRRYGDLAVIDGVLANVGREFYRRVAVPYEEGKIAENGDLPYNE